MRNIRPSWVDIQVDGRTNNIGTGPRSRNGSMYATFYVRDQGSVRRLISVNFEPQIDGKFTAVYVHIDGVLVYDKTFTQ